jgi:hypothetical protein
MDIALDSVAIVAGNLVMLGKVGIHFAVDRYASLEVGKVVQRLICLVWHKQVLLLVLEAVESRVRPEQGPFSGEEGRRPASKMQREVPGPR